MNRLARAREICGLSITQASKVLGWARGPLFAIETGQGAPPSDDDLIKLAALYQTTVAWLLGDEPQISDDNKALLRTVEHDVDRAAVAEFVGMLSTPERAGFPEPRCAKTLEQIRIEREPSEPSAAAAQRVSRKRAYVKRQPQTRKHHCHWPNCDAQVPPAMWGCKAHWFRLPKALRDRIWHAYAPGQEVDMTPSEEYLQVADDVQRWIKEHGA